MCKCAHGRVVDGTKCESKFDDALYSKMHATYVHVSEVKKSHRFTLFQTDNQVKISDFLFDNEKFKILIFRL